MTQVIPDPTVALMEVLKQDSRVADRTEGRVFGQELPANQASHMPRKCIVVTDTAGGIDPWGNSYVRAAGSRFDVRCYGETPYEAMRVQRAAAEALKHHRPGNYADVLLWSITPLTTPSVLRDPDASWPFVLRFWNAYYREVALD